MLHVFHFVDLNGARYRMPVINPRVSPFTVLASLDTDNRFLDLNMMFTFGKWLQRNCCMASIISTLNIPVKPRVI
tara:strand:+ start:979 stop:1203 length:225 start_codon:yes stop_codon:yes gene_type:complete